MHFTVSGAPKLKYNLWVQSSNFKFAFENLLKKKSLGNIEKKKIVGNESGFNLLKTDAKSPINTIVCTQDLVYCISYMVGPEY